MSNQKKFHRIILLLSLIAISLNLLFLARFKPIREVGLKIESASAAPIYHTKAWWRLFTKQTPPIKYARDYTIALVGDSMTYNLSYQEQEFIDILKTLYLGHNFKILNYGFSATNIVSVPQRLQTSTEYLGKIYPPLLTQRPNVFILESMANNPLSQFPLASGLKYQENALDEIVSLVSQNSPQAQIIFLATIAPNKDHYGEGVFNLDLQQREGWAKERAAYLENFISYAHNHHLPIIDVYHQSLDRSGNGDLKYLSPNDYIHPSVIGTRLIHQALANYIFRHRILMP